jgi:hypothetical protein
MPARTRARTRTHEHERTHTHTRGQKGKIQNRWNNFTKFNLVGEKEAQSNPGWELACLDHFGVFTDMVHRTA